MVDTHVTSLRAEGFRISVELVPSMTPDLDAVLTTLEETVRPSFISVTQGAGGTSREQSLFILDALAGRAVRCAHLICGYAPRSEVLRHAANFYASGVRSFLVLKGDKPEGVRGEQEGDYRFASECIRELRALYPDACIGAGAYPEAGEFDRITVLREKFLAGASFAITQMCFDVAAWERLASEFTSPIYPGVCFIHDREHAERFAKRFGVSIPGVPDLAQLIADYRAAGAPGVHLFVLHDIDRLSVLENEAL